MTQKTPQTPLRKIAEKTAARIQNGSDPAMARWQGSIESVLSALETYFVAGQIITIDTLEPEDAASFQKLHATLDLAPYIIAVFLPP